MDRHTRSLNSYMYARTYMHATGGKVSVLDRPVRLSFVGWFGITNDYSLAIRVVDSPLPLSPSFVYACLLPLLRRKSCSRSFLVLICYGQPDDC